MSDQLALSDECCIFATSDDTEAPDMNCKHATDPAAELALWSTVVPFVVLVYVVAPASSITPKATPSKPLTEAVDEKLAVVANALPGEFVTS